MQPIATSSLKVPYDLRPAKQIERRMLVDAFRELGLAGFPISEYRYSGMGSLHFVDFVMFHKLLGISKLTSFEHADSLRKRFEFNRPYDCVELRFAPIGDAIPHLDRDEKHILWLDYDSILTEEQLEDVWQASSILSPGSVLLVTVDVEPPAKGTGGPRTWKKYLERTGGNYAATMPTSRYSLSNLPLVNLRILANAISAGVSTRRNVGALPLFAFDYADGHRMLTVGCMIADPAQRASVMSSRLPQAVYYRGDFAETPYEIHVPVVTRRERLRLDAAMPCAVRWKPAEFQIPERDLRAYKEVYRFLPAYAELLL